MSFPFVVLAAAALTGPTTPQPATTTRYKVEVKTETVVDLSAMGAPSNTLTQTISAWVAVSFADTAGGRTMHVAIDSVAGQAEPPVLTLAMADSAKGAFLHGFVDARNHIKSLVPSPNSGILAASLAGFLNAFLPRLKGESGGVDTVEVQSDSPGQKVSMSVITTYTAAGKETRLGQEATRYSTTFSTTARGTLETPAGPAEMEGTGSGTGTEHVGPGGLYLGGTRTAKQENKVKISMAPEPIPVRVVQTISITPLP